MNDITTTDLAQFGFRELKMAADLLNMYIEPSQQTARFQLEFDREDITVMMNRHFGTVFLTNAECQVAMINHDLNPPQLDMWYYCSYCGAEGFITDIGFNPETGNCESCDNEDQDE